MFIGLIKVMHRLHHRNAKNCFYFSQTYPQLTNSLILLYIKECCIFKNYAIMVI